MNLKSMAALAATVIASTAWAGPTDAKCGAGSCSKKAKTPETETKEASCSKKEASCSKKEEKEASCSKKDASCSKK